MLGDHLARATEGLPFPSRAWRRDTRHTLARIEPHLRPADVVLDVGCGSAFVTASLVRAGWHDVHGVDIVDSRMTELAHFSLYDGVSLPFSDDRFDLVMLNFVLHHVPPDRQSLLLSEVRRVARDRILILEDTPRNAIDRWFNDRHGENFRRKIGSTAEYAFRAQGAWESFLAELGFRVHVSERIGRFERSWTQPFARAAFVLHKA